MATLQAGAGVRRHYLAPSSPFVLAAIAALAMLAGCASTYRAPIVHRVPPGVQAPARTPEAAPPVAVPAQPPIATAPAGAAGAGAAGPGASVAAGAAADAPAATVETVPVPRTSIESRPLPGIAGTVAGSAPTANLLKTEPKALKQPYSEAALAQMKSADAAPTLALAVPSAPGASAPSTVVTPPVAPAGAASGSPAPAATTSSPSSSSKAPASGDDADGYIWPAAGQVVQDFSQPRSMGIAIAGKPGDPIYAVSDGRVIFSGAGPRPYGNLVIVKHANETLSVYAHNRTLLVKEGQSVKRGQRIAELGNSGADGPRLHFEMRDRQGKPVDPRKYLPER